MFAILKSMRCLIGSQWSCWRRVRGLQDCSDLLRAEISTKTILDDYDFVSESYLRKASRPL